MLIDGIMAANRICEEVKGEVEALKQAGIEPTLAVVLVGDDPASEVYVRNKIRRCEQTGIRSLSVRLPKESSQEEVLSRVKELAEDPAVHGILVQLPLPKGLNAEEILREIPAEKDVDGFSAENLGRLARGEEGFVACTPLGVMELLSRYGVDPKGKRAVVIGRSNIVGKPMAMLLLNADATVTVCHSKTANLKEICEEADILVAAVGKPNFVTGDMVKKGAVVIDVGINRVDGKLVGDVEFESAEKIVSLITPVPGGVGPMTVAMLMKNVVKAARRLS